VTNRGPADRARYNRSKTLSVSYFYLALFICFIYINRGDNLRSEVNIGKIVTIIKIN